MTKEEINQAIFNIQTDDEIVEFVKKRISELEEESVETTVGQGYTVSFREYISEKTHYKAVAKSQGECPDLVYDDITPYINLIKEIRINSWYNELTLFTTMFSVIRDYLPNNDLGLGRSLTYLGNKVQRVSIKQIRDNVCAFCSERAGMAHNLFKFLGVDSEVVVGYRDFGRHAYNIVYPNGYGNEPMVIYDTSFSVRFVKDDNSKLAFGYFKALRREEYEKLMAGSPIKLNLATTEKNYRQLYDVGDECVFEDDTPSYIAGLLDDDSKLANLS